MRRYAATLIAGVVLAAGAASGTAIADTVSPSTAPSVRMITYNACGAKCPYPGFTASSWSSKVKKAIDYWSADSIMLTEVCYGQYKSLRNRLRGYAPAWYATSSGPKGCGKWGKDRRFGMAVFVKTGSVQRLTKSLPLDQNDPNRNARGLLCAKGSIEGRTTLSCVTHLTHYSGSYQLQQAETVRRQLNSWAGGIPIILAGDFNATPTSSTLDKFYGFQGGHGRFGEVDERDTDRFTTSCRRARVRFCRSGEPTHTNGKKLDYIFVSAAHFKNAMGDAAARSANMSDHNLLRGAAAWE
ncbi:endonuclease/exonuclease/phosphatase family protein [Nocardiopsis gilva]|nr:endonuclease/exonuclease/phosphatase family protein [Nocardiopsis gilva]